jgi:UDP-N-acetylmuramate dehydrogenase
MIAVQHNIPLHEFTTIRLGGAAAYFCRCTSVEELKEALTYARRKHLPVHVLAGGSNTIFSDIGYAGLVIKMDMKGISITDDGNSIIAMVSAGEQWDTFVKKMVADGYAGMECLSGIPGSVGATPIQNVGAYGQEVKDTILSVTVLDAATMQEYVLNNSECGFSYRTSRFKTVDAGKYIVTGVTFRLKKNGRPTIHYPEVKKIIDASIDLAALADGEPSLSAVRSIVLSLRAKKSMVIDPNDSNTRSVGSFFLNPIVENVTLERIRKIWETIGDASPVPVFPFEGKQKVPAAWLIERSGFAKGYRKNGVGISEHHTLALVNYNGTTAALMALAEEIQNGVQNVFGLKLELEANVIL